MTPSITRWLCATLLLALTQASSAQSTSEFEGRWYQIEMLIFARDNASNEIWPNDFSLSYPDNLVQLKEAEPSEAKENIEDGSTAISTSVATESIPQPFTIIENSLLNNHAATLERKKGYRVLFHRSWQQPVENINTAPSIYIHGGEKFGDHEQLEGSIQISVSRYLHINTKLWLTEFDDNYGQVEHSQWPDLPAPPFRLNTTELFDNDSLISTTTTEINSDEVLLSATPRSTSYSDGILDNFTASKEVDFHTLINSPYVPTRIVKIDQHRRMRSQELHYIDHPLLGILIEATPMQTPEKIETQESSEGKSATEA